MVKVNDNYLKLPGSYLFNNWEESKCLHGGESG